MGTKRCTVERWRRDALAEEILGDCSDHLVLDAAITEPRSGNATHDGYRNSSVLAHHEFRGGAEFVDDAHLGGGQDSPRRIGRPAEVDHGGNSCASKGDIGDASAPGAPEGIGDDDGHVDAEQSPKVGSDATG